GTCAALAAARQGLKVALLHDRPVLGGNASQEIRVWCGGEARHPLVREVRNRFMNREIGAALSDRMRMRLVQDETNVTLYGGWRACGVERTPEHDRIAAVTARQTETGEPARFAAPLFVDATGDGWIGYWAGADYRMGREAAAEFGESMAPAEADRMTLGCSLMWTSMAANTEVPFGPLPWAEPAAQGVVATQGEWNWEYGLDRDVIAEGEAIRDHLLRVIYGSFSLAKRDPQHADRVLDFVPFNLGKRESRRLLGDVILTENDVRDRTPFHDAVATGTWSIDLHERAGGADFLTVCRQPLFGRYWIPWRALYSRNVKNLLMAGRCFSATHVGLGSPRVMNTTGQMGVAVGCAAALCLRHALEPQALAADPVRVAELQASIGGEFPGHPDPAQAGWTVIDDADAEQVLFQGNWKQGLHENGDHVGSGFRYAEQGGTDTWAAYTLPVRQAGMHCIRLTWNVYWDGRARAVPVSIRHARGTLRVTVDMRQGSGLWHDLATVALIPGIPAEVRIETEGTDGVVVADAVAIERIGDA
ncbi:MAG: FAD-dependent oxidoreductase, partial [Kiritimatiellae bacterium]|nr:FAD-dependent oxidoreductase [Kiritimatiellia bacterium]